MRAMYGVQLKDTKRAKDLMSGPVLRIAGPSEKTDGGAHMLQK